MTTNLELHIRQGDWERLIAHLFHDDHDEHGAVVLCGASDTAGRRRLLVREVVPALDGVDYVPGGRGYRHLTGAFVTRQLRRAKDMGLIYLAVHNHGGLGSVEFSPSDMASHERAYPTLLTVSGHAVGGVVVTSLALAGDVWQPGGTREPIPMTVVVGETRNLLRPSPMPQPHTSKLRYDRQSLLFGAAGQELLASMRVGIVGAGGVGMLAVQGLARLGVGELVVIDPDRVSSTNLPRLPEATRWDALEFLARSRFGPLRTASARFATPKVKLARRIVRRANRDTQILPVAGDVADESVARRLVDCDFILLAADSMLARDVVNQIAYQYLIPTLQIGSKVVVDKASGDVLDVYAVVRSLGCEPGCLSCNGLIDPVRLTEETLADEVQRENQRYIDDVDVHAPSVITVNMVAVGWAVNDFMQYAVGLGRPRSGYRILRTQPVTPGGPQLVSQTPDADPDCRVCGLASYSVLSKGDGADLPTRMR